MEYTIILLISSFTNPNFHTLLDGLILEPTETKRMSLSVRIPKWGQLTWSITRRDGSRERVIVQNPWLLSPMLRSGSCGLDPNSWTDTRLRLRRYFDDTMRSEFQDPKHRSLLSFTFSRLSEAD